MTLRLLVPVDENLIPRLLPSELVEGSRPVVTDNMLDKSPGFSGTPFQAKQISEMLVLGLPIEQISKVMKISVAVLQFFYAYEIETAEALVNGDVAKVALRMALSGRNPEMTQFWLKTRAGWSETRKIELSGPDGGAIEIAAVREGLLKVVETHEEAQKVIEGMAREIKDE